MLDTLALREGMDLLTASLGVTLPEVTKKRHLARLERESGSGVDQVGPLHVLVTVHWIVVCERNNGLRRCRGRLMKPKSY